MSIFEYNEKEVMDYIREEEREIMRDQVNHLCRLLLNEKRYDDLERSTRDRDYQEQLFKEYGIDIVCEGEETF